MNLSSITHVFFDWGDTVMIDDPASTTSMLEWEVVEPVSGVEALLALLKTNGKTIILATSAAVSTEEQIRLALARVGLDSFFDKIYCFKNTGLTKSEEFYRYLLKDMQLLPSQALMVGDSFEKDVLSANQAGIATVWFNEKTNANKRAPLCITVHSMKELVNIFATGNA
jgi:HAD superfamily hydrolase (TIGR01509 family)